MEDIDTHGSRNLDTARLKAIVEERGLEVGDFAEQSGLTKSLAKKLLAGVRGNNPTLATITKLLNWTGLSFAELFPVQEKMKAAA